MDTKWIAAAHKLESLGYRWRCDEWAKPEAPTVEADLLEALRGALKWYGPDMPTAPGSWAESARLIMERLEDNQ